MLLHGLEGYKRGLIDLVFFSMFFLAFFTFLLGLVLATTLTTIQENTVDSGDRKHYESGDVSIFPGKYWSIINKQHTSITGQLSVGPGSGFYVAGDKLFRALSVLILGRVINKGTISLLLIQSTLAPLYSLNGVSFENTAEGKVWMGGDASAATAHTYITASKFTNEGFMSFYQQRRSSGRVYLGLPGFPLTNDGTICLKKQDYAQLTKIYGSGCIRAQEDAAVLLQAPLNHIDTTHTFVMDSATSKFQVAGVKPKNPFKIAGYGNGNAIGSQLGIRKFKYNEELGILRVYTSLLIYFEADIGKGYDASKFVLSNVQFGLVKLNNNALVYNGPIPEGANKVPSTCLPCAEAPAAPQQ